MGEGTLKHEDRWVPTFCSGCYGGVCPLKVHVVDGVAVKIEGDPDAPLYNGRICSRGQGAIMHLYNPYRLKAPMKRTNPEKGIGVDPRWVEISWEEAIDTLVKKLTEVREKNPRGLYTGSMDTHTMHFLGYFLHGFGLPFELWFTGAGPMCGEAIHALGPKLDGTFISFPDLQYCKYAIVVGGSIGESWMLPTIQPQLMTEGREKRGLKMVVIDPSQTHAAAIADEWIPIRPATDGALFLAMMEVLVHEEEIYDREFLKRQTNCPYLIGEDGHYVRDSQTLKPLIWDAVEGKAKAFDDPTVKDYTLEGSYRIEEGAPARSDTGEGTQRASIECKTGFQLFKEHIRQYTPEWASELTTIPAATIRRLAKELGEAAQIGSTIVLEGKEYAYRPACVTGYRGLNNHTNSPMTEFSRIALNMLLGASRSPGGVAGQEAFAGYNPKITPYPGGEDGLTQGEFISNPGKPWKFPFEDIGFTALWLFFIAGSHTAFYGAADPEKYGVSKEALPEMLIHWRLNPMMNNADPKLVAKALSNIPFYVDFTLFLDESDDFADLVIPDCTFLERLGFGNTTGLMEGLPLQQPVVPPLHKSRNCAELLWEIGDRMGILTGPEGMIMGANYEQAASGKGSWEGPWVYDPNRKYSFEEFVDAACQGIWGKDLAWFKEHGHNYRRIPADKLYYRWGWDQYRLPFYFEELKTRGEKLRENMERDRVKEKIGLDPDVWCRQCNPLPTWEPSVIHNKDPKYDLYAQSRRSPLARGSTWPGTNTWLMEIAERDPYFLKIRINSETAKKKGLADGDLVWVESEVGRVQGRVVLTECIHPEVLGFSGNAGHWMKHPFASNKAPHFNSLLPHDLEHTAPVAPNLEGTAKVRIYKA